MSQSVFVDTGFWIGLMDTKDSKHIEATRIFDSHFSANRITTSEWVISETVTYLNCSLKRHDLAIAFLNQTESVPMRILTTDTKTQTDAWKIFRQYAESTLSHVDCVSFALMKAHGITCFAGFDSHFLILGFHPLG